MPSPTSSLQYDTRDLEVRCRDANDVKWSGLLRDYIKPQ